MNNNNVMDEPFKPIDNSNSNNKNNDKKENDVINSFPDWDLLPPYQAVRRINRK